MQELEKFLSVKNFDSIISATESWLQVYVLNWAALIQLSAILGAIIFAALLTPLVRRTCDRLAANRRFEFQRVFEFPKERVTQTISAIVLPAIWLLLLWICTNIAAQMGEPYWLIDTAESLLGAWIVIRVASVFIRDPSWARAFAVTAWCVAALRIFSLLDPTIRILNDASFKLGELQISAWSVIKGGFILAVLLWLANLLSRLLDTRVSSLPNLTPSIQVLIAKIAKIVLITVAVVVSLSSIGIDLTAFAVFSGAVGVGVGFGLQKVVSNLISGIILLLDRSVKPGDVIAIADYYGRIDTLNARYVSVITRDGAEHLVPNEELITQRVENWSYSNNLLRLRRAVGISYRSDVELAIQLCKDACDSVDRVLKDPKPVCLIKGFGDSSVDLEMRFWINDPMNGRANVTSEIYLAVWKLFHEHGIEIPFPQRDLHLKSPSPLSIINEEPTSA
jgi:small-conductance mechanosensitive channel